MIVAVGLVVARWRVIGVAVTYAIAEVGWAVFGRPGDFDGYPAAKEGRTGGIRWRGDACDNAGDRRDYRQARQSRGVEKARSASARELNLGGRR